MVFVHRRFHVNENDVGQSQFMVISRRSQLAAGGDLSQQVSQPRLLPFDGILPGINLGHPLRLEVHADNGKAGLGKGGGHRQPHVAETDHANDGRAPGNLLL
jgi:hypothetical protein